MPKPRKIVNKRRPKCVF